jgi:hypothetical protein
VFKPIYSTARGGVNACGHYYPDTFARLQTHVAAMAAVVNAVPEAVAFIEAGLLGAWGDWHCWGTGGCITNAILTDKIQRQQVSAEIRNAFLDRLPVLLPRPAFKLEGLAEVLNNTLVGLANCCVLTTSDADQIDQGTFSAEYGGFLYGSTTAQELCDATKAISHTMPMGGSTLDSAQNRCVCYSHCRTGAAALRLFRECF